MSKIIENIKREICTFYDCDESVFKLKSRKRSIVEKRQIAYYLALKHSSKIISLKGIDYEIRGLDDHAVVLHSYKNIQNLMKFDKRLKEDVEYIEKQIIIDHSREPFFVEWLKHLYE